MSTQELKNLWSEQSDERFPAYRADDSPIHSFYPIDNYIVLLDGEDIVGAVGFSERNGFTLRGGSFSVPKYRKKGLFNTILAEADKLSPPFIAGFRSNVVNDKEWVKSNKKKGWIMNPTDEELGEYADNPTVMGFKDFYGNSPTGAKWAVKGLPPSKMLKSDIKMTWQDILKKKGLWANIHAKRKRGEQPAKEGDEDYPDASSWQKVTKKKPNKGKRFVSKEGTSYGQAGKAKDGTDRIKPNTKDGDAYCARSNKIKGDWRKDPDSPNNLSRRKWKCHGNKSSA